MVVIDAAPAVIDAPLAPARMTVHLPGVQTTVQDVTGRTGFWDVGVPPSGAFDELSAELGRRAVGNPATAAGLEFAVLGPTVSFDRPVLVCLTGGVTSATAGGRPVSPGRVVRLAAGETLAVGALDGPGLRGYLAVGGGLAVPRVLGSRSTFILGGFGGHEGRVLAIGDVLEVGSPTNLAAPVEVTPLLPDLTSAWELRVIAGPHGAPDYLTETGVAELFAAQWRVDHRADRTGVRLVGPAPRWSRTDGGEAGIHASNLHDSAYPVGGIMLSGDTPVIVGKDGPSLGGFVVMAVVIAADLWKVGQLRPGDQVRLRPVTVSDAEAAAAAQRAVLADVPGAVATRFHRSHGRLDAGPGEGGSVGPGEGGSVGPGSVRSGLSPATARPAPLAARPARAHLPAYTIRVSGDRHLLVEVGTADLDLTVRVWVHLLAQALRAHAPAGVRETVEGVRSLLVALDEPLRPGTVAGLLDDLASQLPDPAAVTLDVREVSLPIAFDHPEAHEAMQRYSSVNPTAPWSPDNVEFIRRVNDLDERADVFDIVARARYLVVGLGDVYLGAPVAVPVDPRDRLVTTKYNPARTWTPQNAVGIGGIYLCVYGMEGPGGYQLVGRTVPVWRLSAGDPAPWLLRQFDILRFHPVSVPELQRQRAEIAAGRQDLSMRPTTFSVREVTELTERHRDEIDGLRSRRRAAFDAERARWSA